MISLTLNRAGTVPILDMTFYAPPIYVFGVLEINIAIIAACVPVFWPVITGLAVNKIFVLREINVRVEDASRSSSAASMHDVVLTPQGTWKDDGIDPFGKTDPYKDIEGRTSRVSVVPKVYDRANSRSSNRPHMHFTRTRSSEDSLQYLNKRTSQDDNVTMHGVSSGELSREPSKDYFRELEREINGGQTVTTVQRARIPLQEIRAYDQRRRM